MGSARQALDFEIHHPVQSKGHDLVEEISVGALLKQFLEEHSDDGHGFGVLSVRVCKPNKQQLEP
jgi:hypothetical protein